LIGGVFVTVKVAGALVADPTTLLTVTVYCEVPVAVVTGVV
jgi:hypothetical protein